MIEKIKKYSAIKYIIVFSITLIFALYFAVTPAKARIIKEGTNTSAILANKSAAEKQFWDKLQIIKSVAGNSVDVPALAATVLYGSSSIDVANAEYESDYSGSDYKSFFSTIKTSVDDKVSSGATSGYQKSGASNLSKLAAAAIVMIDSSGGLSGTYSDENYQKALEGDKLVGNLWGDDDECLTSTSFNPNCLFGDAKRVMSYGYNALFCGAGALVDTFGTFLELPFSTILWGNSASDTINQKFNRGVTMTNVCQYGYVAGVNAGIRSIKDEDKRNAKKKEYAEGIINLAEVYRYYYEDDDKCVYSSSSDNSDEANWRQCAESWGDKSVGGADTMCNIGCAVTSLAYIIKKSGTALSTDNFDPGVFVEKAQFDGDGNIYWESSISNVAPKGHRAEPDVSISYSNAASVIKNVLETPTNGHKTFVQLYITNHYIAVDHVDGDTIYVMDPAASSSGLTTLDDALNRGGTTRQLISYNTYYFDDVNEGSSNSSNDSSNSYNTSAYQKRLEDITSLFDQKSGSIWDIEDKYNSEESIKTKMQSGSATAALAASYYLYTGKKPDGYEFYKAAYDDGVKTDSSGSMEPIYKNSASTLKDKFGLSGKKLSSYNIDSVINELKSGNKIIAGIKDSSFGQDHFVLLDHYNESSDQIYVYNPNKENNKNGYFSKDEVRSEIVDKVAYDLTVINSDSEDSNSNYCSVSGDGDIEAFITLLEQIEGGCDACTTSSGQEGCVAAKVAADQTDVGNTTAWGFTQRNSISPGLAADVGYANYDADMSNGCANKEYLKQMLRNEIAEQTEYVKSIYEEAYPGKSLKTCQYHAFVLFYHHWPAMTPTFIKTVGGMDFMSYEAYTYYLDHNGGGGMQGLLNRREAEYHLLNTCKYDITKVMDASYDKSYWEGRIKLYKEELGQS